MLLLLLSPQSITSPDPKYALPGRSLAAVTGSIMRDSWCFCLGILLSYLGQFLLLPAILGFVQWEVVGSWYPLLLQVGTIDACVHVLLCLIGFIKCLLF
jgi:hypothetical protein